MKKSIIYLLLSVMVISSACVPYAMGGISLPDWFLQSGENCDDTQSYACEFPVVFNSKLENVTVDGKSIPAYTIGNEVLPALAILGQTQTVADTPIPNSKDEVRGVWIPYLSLFGANAEFIDAMVQRVKSYGLNTIYFHVRPFGDALYNSDYFPWSHLLSGTQGAPPENNFDPLEYAVKVCHANGIELHAWINPLRVQSAKTTPSTLSADNPAVIAMAQEGDRRIIEYNDSLYYNPSIEDNIILIVNGVKEIVERYDVDGIHFDDYFYPASDESFDDAAEFAAYKNGGGKLSLSDWRKENISNMVKRVYSAVKECDSSIEFGISPSGNIARCEQYGADVRLWCSTEGYVDYICPQIYWSQSNPDFPFEQTAKDWRALVTCDKIKLYIGLALYKAGSDSDNGTWQSSSSNIADQIRLLRGKDIAASGFALYSYSYLSSSKTSAEMENLQTVIR